MEITLVLPHLPNPDANPNSRSGYAINKDGGQYNPKLSKAKKNDREEMFLTVLQQGKPDEPFEKAHISITYKSKDKRDRDMDNLLSAMKGTIDGLVDAGVMVDDSAKHLCRYILDYKFGCEADETIIHIKEIK
jgi:Holliday junction resolvase RusA-like endonuclease